jgi:chemotaxis protein histidine kinase CheA
MFRRATQLSLALFSFVVFSALALARAPQMTAASAAAAQANAQAAQAQASAAQAAMTQAQAQITAAQTAYRTALQNAAKAPAVAKPAAQSAVDQAMKNMQAAQTAYRTAAQTAISAQTAAAQAAAQSAQAQAQMAQQAAAAKAAAASNPTAASTAAKGVGSGGAGAGAGAGGNSTLTQVNSILSTVTGAGASKTAGAKGGAGTGGAGNGNPTAANTPANGAAGNSFTSDGGAKNGRGGAQPEAVAAVPDAPAPTGRKAGTGLATGSLGVGQSNDTILTVYGCNRMGTQVTCDTDLSNQNNTLTQMKSLDQWKDAYLVDDKGDHHMRAIGFFENNDGDQRTQIDLPYGEKSRYILVFNGVPTGVKTVTLKSTANVLDVESIPVTTAGAPSGDSDAAAAPAQPGVQNATAPSSGQPARSKVPHS